jgi:hypothetical protein
VIIGISVYDDVDMFDVTGPCETRPRVCQPIGSENGELGQWPQATAITGGAEGNRTPDLLNAIQALSQLSYSPDR